jgi:glutamate synthase (NADPH) small chain
MGKVTGFLENTRELPNKRPVNERVNDYKEFVERYSDEQLNKQSARCMNCGVPFCHNGCPLGNIIPEFNDAVYKKEWREAYEILNSTNNFPEFTGRICPAPCESACVLGINQPAVAIEEIEKHIIEIAFENNYVTPNRFISRTGKKVAVIGSGPAGLAAAAQLNIAGHLVTVFERDAEPGGLLRYGIPDFKLEKWVISRRIEILKQEGIIFKCNSNVGVDVSISKILREFNAIVLAGGSTIPRDLAVEGRDAKGVYFAMDFLKQQNQRNANEPYAKEAITVENKNVIVIGGGDTGSDCVGTANRQKAKSIIQFELLPTPPVTRDGSTPWPHYPMLLKTTSSHEEGAEREWATATKTFVKDAANNLIGLKVVKLQWTLGANGAPATFTEIPGSEKELPCEAAFLAMGFLHPQQQGMLEQLGISLDSKGNIAASEKNYQTNIEKVFAAGDMRRGQSLVVWAISEGRECARQVDLFLMGYTHLPGKNASLVDTAVVNM